MKKGLSEERTVFFKEPETFMMDEVIMKRPLVQDCTHSFIVLDDCMEVSSAITWSLFIQQASQGSRPGSEEALGFRIEGLWDTGRPVLESSLPSYVFFK